MKIFGVKTKDTVTPFCLMTVLPTAGIADMPRSTTAESQSFSGIMVIWTRSENSWSVISPREHHRVNFSSPGGLVTHPTQPLRANGRTTQGRTGFCSHSSQCFSAISPSSRPRTTFPLSPTRGWLAGKAGDRSGSVHGGQSTRRQLLTHRQEAEPASRRQGQQA